MALGFGSGPTRAWRVLLASLVHTVGMTQPRQAIYVAAGESGHQACFAATSPEGVPGLAPLSARLRAAGVAFSVESGPGRFCGCSACDRAVTLVSLQLALRENRPAAVDSCLERLGR